jgi:hypothetical protein
MNKQTSTESRISWYSSSGIFYTSQNPEHHVKTSLWQQPDLSRAGAGFSKESAQQKACSRTGPGSSPLEMTCPVLVATARDRQNEFGAKPAHMQGLPGERD